jgi:hypothetical protein
MFSLGGVELAALSLVGLFFRSFGTSAIEIALKTRPANSLPSLNVGWHDLSTPSANFFEFHVQAPKGRYTQVPPFTQENPSKTAGPPATKSGSFYKQVFERTRRKEKLGRRSACGEENAWQSGGTSVRSWRHGPALEVRPDDPDRPHLNDRWSGVNTNAGPGDRNGRDREMATLVAHDGARTICAVLLVGEGSDLYPLPKNPPVHACVCKRNAANRDQRSDEKHTCNATDHHFISILSRIVVPCQPARAACPIESSSHWHRGPSWG